MNLVRMSASLRDFLSIGLSDSQNHGVSEIRIMVVTVVKPESVRSGGTDYGQQIHRNKTL
jgi:hypothetical protein